MDCEKIGKLIKKLRKGQRLTQAELAEQLTVTDKAVSKWERGLGCPDVSVLPALSGVLGVNLEELLSGELPENDAVGGNMKKTVFYVCPDCGNVIAAFAEAAISCCGHKLSPETPQKAEGADRLSVEKIENDYFISSAHEMTKEHHISFIALLTGDALMLKKLYPEWNAETRIPCFGHGRLVYGCTRHGLFEQYI